MNSKLKFIINLLFIILINLIYMLFVKLCFNFGSQNNILINYNESQYFDLFDY